MIRLFPSASLARRGERRNLYWPEGREAGFRAARSQAGRRDPGRAWRGCTRLPRSERERRQPSTDHCQACPHGQPLYYRHQHGIHDAWSAVQGAASDRHHSKDEYVRGDVYTNTVEGYFSILKRGIYGIHQHVSEAHLHRYLAEFDFRYSHRIKLGVDDVERADLILEGAWGRRLTYRTTRGTRPAARPAYCKSPIDHVRRRASFIADRRQLELKFGEAE